MAYSEWTFNILNGSAAVDPQIPLLGSASVRLQAVGNSQTRIYGRRNAGGGYTPGLTRGRMRTLFRVSEATLGCGFLVMVSTTTPATANANFYEIGKKNSANQVLIAKTTAGTASFTSTLVNAAYTFVSNTTYAMQAEWRVDDTGIGGIFLGLSIGTATNFSDLVPVLAWVDPTTTRFTTTVGEGLAAAWNLVPVHQVNFDQTLIYALS